MRNEERKMQELFIPVSGYIKFFPEEIAIINHPSFQRLRRMRQLGLAHLVYPGASHTRFEHSLGTLSAAQKIIDNINSNYYSKFRKSHLYRNNLKIKKIDENTTRFIRLAALLHDIGHVPFGHTLENELNHLPLHDNQSRFEKIVYRENDYIARFDKKFIDGIKALTKEEKNEFLKMLKTNKISLWNLINFLFKQYVPNGIADSVNSYEILSHIICKKLKNDNTELIQNYIMLQVCKDLVGDTICADFLDYIFRDWYHIGKPINEDKRLYQYMEVLSEDEKLMNYKFVVNGGNDGNIRHDALTCIMELLDYRYKLTETVLFHRTKLSFIALLDRCLLEIRNLFEMCGVDSQKFENILENNLINASDDGFFNMLHSMIEDLSPNYNISIKENQEDTISEDTFAEKKQIIKRLILDLMNRTVYSQCSFINKTNINKVEGLEKDDVIEFISLYKEPRNRLHWLETIESALKLEKASLVFYCPVEEEMNAKIANVNIYLDGKIVALKEYEDNSEGTSLTGGILTAQVKRFLQLWATRGYMRHTQYEEIKKSDKKRIGINKILNGYMMKTNNPEMVPHEIEGFVRMFNPAMKTMIAARDTGKNNSSKNENIKFLPNGVSVYINDVQ